MVSQGHTGEGEPKITPFAGVGIRPEAAPVATPVQSSEMFGAHAPVSPSLPQGGLPSTLGLTNKERREMYRRFMSDAARDYCLCFGGAEW